MYISKRNTTNGILPIGSNLFGTCTTAAATATKSVTLSDFDVLVEGVTVHVHFTNGNTAQTPSLKVGSTSAMPIKDASWDADSVASFTYHNGYWCQNDVQTSGKVYGLSVSGNTLSLVENGGSSTVTISTSDTTYSISISGNIITLTGSDGSTSTVTIPTSQATITASGTGTVQGFPYYYETYSNGTTKYWITVTGTTAVSTSGGGGYVSDMKNFSISGLGLSTIHNIQMQFAYGHYSATSHIYSYDTSQISWYFWSATSITSRAYTTWFEIIGA